MSGGPRVTSVESEIKRFWTYVDKESSPTGCWLWKGHVSHLGYGYYSAAITGCALAHRYAKALFEPLTKKDKVLHKANCPNRHCVNPEHTYIGTQADNNGDKALKYARYYAGEIWLMRRLHFVGGYSYRFIAKMFNCTSASAVCKYCNHSVMTKEGSYYDPTQHYQNN